MGLFELLEAGEAPVEPKESAEALIQGFRSKAPCHLCSLSEVNPQNPGFLFRGNMNAKIAVLTDSPFSEDIVGQSVFCGPGRQSWDLILKYLKLRDDDFFMTYVLQCRTDKDVVVRKRKRGKKTVHSVDPEAANRQDLLTCFNLHTLQVLRSLPNLEVIIATGKIPVQVILKEDFQSDKHAGNFFISEFFPRVPVFCLDHPRAHDIAGDYKLSQLKEHLAFFAYKYLKTKTILKFHAHYKACMDAGREVSLNTTI